MSASGEFERILNETQSVIRAYIAGMGVPLDTVDDLAQEVYVEFYKGRDRRPADVEPIRWLKGIAKNLSLNYFRKSRREAEQKMEAVAELLERIPEPLKAVENPAQLDGCLEKLPGRSRQMVALRYVDGLESSDIGEQVGLSAEAVRIALLRIRGVLRECLERGLAREAAR